MHTHKYTHCTRVFICMLCALLSPLTSILFLHNDEPLRERGFKARIMVFGDAGTHGSIPTDEAMNEEETRRWGGVHIQTGLPTSRSCPFRSDRLTSMRDRDGKESSCHVRSLKYILLKQGIIPVFSFLFS